MGIAAQSLRLDNDEVGKVVDKHLLDTASIISAPNGAETYLVAYGSRDAEGLPYKATGLVTLPAGEAPEGGWPVLSWAHGTTGLAREAAPSLALKTHPDEEALVMSAQDYLKVWLDKGFAVVQPDYEGLGTVGKGTYMDRHSLASAVNELVRAARAEFELSESWYNTGWSQGGFAAVSAASADDVASGLVMTLAIAPGDTLVPTEIPANQAQSLFAEVDEERLTYNSYAVQGAMNFNPKIVAEDFLNDKGLEALELASRLCLTEFKHENTIHGREIMRENPQLKPLLEHLYSNSMVHMHPTTPVRIFISEDDGIIDYEQISTAAKGLQENEGTDVEIIVRRGVEHRGMVRRAIEDQTPIVDALQ
ncbi:hypothetical protein C3B44_06495 [Corynebacterium yudongzhengii]|uniref:Lipase n=1 Tax=Corynebacterium yudongzhengii TaxID=2080740 RepID=A0A2U1T9J5_9CORY|nr:hypothetical protein C3B44_06495 [Corynebacterium yudongzhengii]PWC02548.1 hypothetical protein DF222_00965 [Corynebacterium yudongzhengii]